MLVTGGARRIGAAIARRFGAAGWHVVIHYGSSRSEAERLAETLPSAECLQCDLADGDAAVAMVETLAQRLGDWRALVNCAAIFDPDRVTALDPETNARTMQINARTPTRMAQAYLAGAQAPGGRRVIQLTDQKLANPNPDFFSYTMSKHAVAATVPMLAMGAAGARELGRKTGADEVADAALFLAAGHLASGQTLYIDSGQHLLSQPRDVIYLARAGQAA